MQIHYQDAEISFVSKETPIGLRPVLMFPHAAAVLAIEKDSCFMVKQYRIAKEAVTWELPAGKAHQGEDILDCAKRELAEETGLTAVSWQFLKRFYPAIGISTEVIHIFLASNLRAGAMNPDVDEDLSCEKVLFTEYEKMVKENLIDDAKTLLGFYLWQELRLSEKI